jgi:hypothetical protein
VGNSLGFLLTLDLGAILGYFSEGGSLTAEENRLWQRQREYCQEDGSSSEPADGCPATPYSARALPRTAPRRPSQ